MGSEYGSCMVSGWVISLDGYRVSNLGSAFSSSSSSSSSSFHSSFKKKKKKRSLSVPKTLLDTAGCQGLAISLSHSAIQPFSHGGVLVLKLRSWSILVWANLREQHGNQEMFVFITLDSVDAVFSRHVPGFCNSFHVGFQV